MPEKAYASNTYNKDNDNPTNSQPSKQHPLYKTSGTGKSEAALVCKKCLKRKEIYPKTQVSYMLKSNQAAYEEFKRLSSYLDADEIKCRNAECSSNMGGTAKLKKRGLAASGNQRYQCLVCNKGFTDSDGSRRHLRPEINLRFFDLLVAKVPLRKIAKLLNISTRTIYTKIDFLHKQCLAFVGERENKLSNGKLKLDRLYLATDRQIQTTNWSQKEDKRNTELYGIGTACLKTGYVFGFNFNFDNSISQKEAEEVAVSNTDLVKPKHHRTTARIWLEQDFEEAAKKKKSKDLPKSELIDRAEQKSKEEAVYNQSLSSEDFDKTTKLPSNGVLIHNEYTMLGHFLLLKRLFKHVGKTRFYMDQDTGMKNAYLSIFKDNILHDTSHGFLVRSEKNTTVNEKQTALGETNKLIKEMTGIARHKLSSKEFRDVVNELILDKMDKLITVANSNDKWLEYPIATNPEPSKIVAAITDISSYDLTHQANLYRKASLHAIDRFFMISRRDVSLLERGFSSSTNKARVWNGYNAYDPAMLAKVGDIYRVYFNYVNTNQKRKTPAMRLGLAKGPVTSTKIIYFGKY